MQVSKAIYGDMLAAQRKGQKFELVKKPSFLGSFADSLQDPAFHVRIQLYGSGINYPLFSDSLFCILFMSVPTDLPFSTKRKDSFAEDGGACEKIYREGIVDDRCIESGAHTSFMLLKPMCKAVSLIMR